MKCHLGRRGPFYLHLNLISIGGRWNILSWVLFFKNSGVILILIPEWFVVLVRLNFFRWTGGGGKSFRTLHDLISEILGFWVLRIPNVCLSLCRVVVSCLCLCCCCCISVDNSGRVGNGIPCAKSRILNAAWLAGAPVGGLPLPLVVARLPSPHKFIDRLMSPSRRLVAARFFTGDLRLYSFLYFFHLRPEPHFT